jgi:hypothetical protein|tara:strand:- start:330 stop:1946 length:1617 start_codon:yes stop_codon:yes gene_type:complete
MSALPQTGAISLIQIANEFGVTSGARSLKSFYRGGSNVSDTEVVTTSATNAPSNNTPVSNFAGVTGLTLSADLTTLSTDGNGRALIYIASNDAADRTLALNSTYSYEANDILEVYVKNAGGQTSRVTGTYTSGTISTSPITRQGDNPGHATVTNTGFSVQGSDPGVNSQTSETSFFTTNITGAGVLDLTSISGNLNPVLQYMTAYVRVNPGSDGQAVTVVRDDGTLFTNNSAYAVNITGNATNTVQVGGTLTGAFPDSNNQYTCSYTPVSNDQTATTAPPTGDSPVNNFGGITGLTCTKIASNASGLSNTNTAQTVTLTSGVYYNFTAKVVWNMIGGSAYNKSLAYGGYRMGSDRADSGVTVGVSVSATGSSNAATNRDAGTFYNGVSQGGSFTGQPLLAVSDLARGGGRHALNAQVSISITVIGTPSADTVLDFSPGASSAPSRNTGNSTFGSQTLTNSTTSLFNFTNNTGFPVTISGSGVTTTTIPDGGTNNEALAEPSGNFTIQYQIANAQALNGNIPESGAISLTNFYGTEDFS